MIMFAHVPTATPPAKVARWMCLYRGKVQFSHDSHGTRKLPIHHNFLLRFSLSANSVTSRHVTVAAKTDCVYLRRDTRFVIDHVY